MEKTLINERQLFQIVHNVINKVLNRVDLDDGIYEFTEPKDIKKYSKTAWTILQNSYKKLGGFASYTSSEEMENRISLLIICVRHSKIVACAIYRDDLGGQKLNGYGTIDGSSQNKEILRNVIRNDIENFNQYHWVEASYPLEKWFKEMGGNPIPSQLAHKLLHKSKSKINPLEDNVNYQREIGRDHVIVTKAIYGFSSEKVYINVMQNLEKYTRFDNYDDFKQYINGLPKITEEIDYLDNNPDEKVALAMEVIIQIGNIWDEGVRELTPKMHEFLKNSVSILNQCNNENNKQIVALIKNGDYYLNNMDVLHCYSSEKFNYILAPAL